MGYKAFLTLIFGDSTYHLIQCIFQLGFFGVFATFLQQMITVFGKQFYKKEKKFLSHITLTIIKNPHNNRSAQLSISNLPGDLVLAFAFFVTELLFMNFPQALSRLATNPLSLAKAVKTNALYFL